MIKIIAIFGAAAIVLAGVAYVKTQKPQEEPWQGVWVEAPYDCPDLAALKAADVQDIYGDHWHIFAEQSCDAARGDLTENEGALQVHGICRSFGRLKTESWLFQTVNADEALVELWDGRNLTLKRCAAAVGSNN